MSNPMQMQTLERHMELMARRIDTLEKQLPHLTALLRRCLYECDWQPRHNGLVQAIMSVPGVKDKP